MKLRALSLALMSASLVLAGCDANSPSSASDNAVPASTVAHPVFQPLAQDAAKLPFPNDMLFSGSADGSINIPGVANSDTNTIPANPADFADPKVALNTMSGWSTTAMISIPFSANMQWADADAQQQNLAQGIRIFETNGNFILGQSAAPLMPSAVVRELAYGVDFVAQASGSTIAVLPLRPLASAKSYIVAVTTALKSAKGINVSADGQYLDARDGNSSTLPPSLTILTTAYEGLAAAYTAANPFPSTVLQPIPGVGSIPVALVPGAMAGPGDTTFAMTFGLTTQNITAALQQAQGIVAQAAAGALSGAGINPPQLTVTKAVDGDNPAQGATGMDVFAGKLESVVSFLNTADPVHSVWNNNGNNLAPNPADLMASYRPTPAGTVNIPVMVTAPSANAQAALSCPANMPVVIYQHGITRNRGDLLAIAPKLVAKCTIGIAIDMPEHGILQGDTLGPVPLGTIATITDAAFSIQERLVVAGAFGPAPAGCMKGNGTAADGRTVCGSGDSYINLANLANSRDVVRQSVVDLDTLYVSLKLAAAAGGIAELPSGQIGIDPSSISFVGQSLGSIVGETFVATLGNGPIASSPFSGDLKRVVFNVGGAGIAKLLDGSPSIEPTVVAGLHAAQDITKPSSTYESFMIAAQTLVDSADPINYADDLAALKTTTPILFQEVLNDDTVPNNVFGTAFGPAWGAVTGGGQIGWLLGQNNKTIPAALGGTDSLVQGTGFIALAQVYKGAVEDKELNPPTGNDPNTPMLIGCVTAYGPLCPAITVATSSVTGGPIEPFTGIGLPQVNSDGLVLADVGGAPTAVPAPYGVVRFKTGTHGSLLSPSVANANNLMQEQIAKFIADGTIIGEANCTADCSDTVADWPLPTP